jgi:L-cystine uptake protein TcyP (sodium:dicarboxylate symporter family)
MTYQSVNPTFINVAVALAACVCLYQLQRRRASFAVQVFTGMGLGVAIGAAMHWVYGVESPVIKNTNAYLDIVGSGYVKLLQMIVIPLIMVSIVAAIVKLKDTAALGKISALTIGTLMLTTLVAAGVGIGMANLFGLTAVGLTASAAEVAQGAVLQNSQASATAVTLPSVILSFVPANPFLDMTGARKTSTIAVVVFSIFIGLGATGMALKKPAQFASFEGFVDVAQAVTIQVVKMVLRLTPYGVFALMAQVVAKTSIVDIVKLLSFVLASYSAILVMFGVHLALIALVGLNPVQYLKKVLPLLVFAFTSRSSAGAIPMNIQTQTQALGTPTGIANFAASFGATMGQNGCAGIYPAMLAVMIAPTVGIDPYTFSFMAMLMAVVTIGSIGVAGVGGGATFAALIVLSAMDLPVALAGLLISIEPLIDMGRTALNVSGSATAGTVASRLMGQTDVAVFNSNARLDLQTADDALPQEAR